MREEPCAEAALGIQYSSCGTIPEVLRMKVKGSVAIMDEQQIPLVVDLDGTLLRTDTLWEGIRTALFHSPLLFIKYVWRLIVKSVSGNPDVRLAFKWDVTPWILQGVEGFPLNQEVFAALRQAGSSGRPCVLATGSTMPVAQAVAKRLGIFTAIFASTRECNLIGEEKARLLVDAYGNGGFDYIGDSGCDVPVWRHARCALAVGAPPVKAAGIHLIGLNAENYKTRLRTLAKAMRVHQWVKNLLVFVPMLAAHSFTWAAFCKCILAFFALSLCASAIYLVNDVLDINDDRAHPRKSSRPFASGALPLILAPLLFCVVIGTSFLFASLLSSQFALFLLIYMLSSLTYSMIVKKMVVADILVLAWLYVLRIILGIEAINCDFSRWLFFFFFFLFLGLASVKRLGALRPDMAKAANSRRGWEAKDRDFLLPFSICCGIGATVVFGIYCNSAVATTHYTHPDYLLAITVIILYWYQKIVLLANRGTLSEDPLDYALKDKKSYTLYFTLGILFLLSL